MLNRGEGQGTEESTDRSRDGGRVSSSSVQKGEHSRASWQMREQGAWGEEATCAQVGWTLSLSSSTPCGLHSMGEGTTTSIALLGLLYLLIGRT